MEPWLRCLQFKSGEIMPNEAQLDPMIVGLGEYLETIRYLQGRLADRAAANAGLQNKISELEKKIEELSKNPKEIE